MEVLKMDEILDILKENAKITPEELSVMLKIPVEEIKARIKKLEEDKVILKYSAIINPEKSPTHKENVLAFIEVRVRPEREKGFDALAERLYRFPEVKSLYLMSGAYDFLVVVEGKTLKDVAFFVSEKLSVQENVKSTATHFLLKTFKENGTIIDSPEEIERLVVSP